VPVILLIDEVLAHMRENIPWPQPGEIEVIERRRPDDAKDFKPFADAAFLPFGAGARFHVTGMSHGAEGFVVNDEAAARELRRMMSKIHDHTRELSMAESFMLDDADVAIVSYGITSRPARSAVEQLRERGTKAGLLDLKTLWPFPDHLIDDVADHVEQIFVPELNLGQLVREIQRAALGCCEVHPINRVDGHLLTPAQIVEPIKSHISRLAGGAVTA
jgi:2-oxoglutarate ferredoxin oxidoreductase subunit alpha